MEGKLKAILRVSLALTIALSLGLLVAFPVGAANGPPWIFDTPGESIFVVPDDVTTITVQAWGGGGAGGGSTNAGFLSGRCGAGGGGGAYAIVTLPVTEGQELRVVVGAGGIGVSGGDGDHGGSSFVERYTVPPVLLVRAAGGSGGTANTAGGKPPGGPGGQAGESTGDYVETGDPGEPGATCFTSVSGAGGAGAFGGGAGGASQGGAYVTADGNPGEAPGGGGGGARTSQFDGPRPGGAGAPGRVVITTGITCPTISPTTAQYDLANPGDVTTTITWNDASSITSIHDGTAYLTPSADYTVVGNTLTILNSYLAGELTAVDDSAMLTITFDICSPVIFTITAIDTAEEECADLAPTTGQYDLANPGNLTWTITWNDTSSITSIHDDVGDLTSGTDYTVVGNTLTILNAYLAGKLTEAGDNVVLTINCDICSIMLTITAIDSSQQVCPTISPTTAQYDLANPGNVITTITWNDATSITSIHDGVAYLASGADYTVVGNTLTILNSYLAAELTAVDDTAVLTITFDICSPIIFTITAIDSSQPICATIWPTTAQYDLANPGNVITTITWNDATSITSIHDGVAYLASGTDYTVVGNTLTILNSYLAAELTAVDDTAVLTITFDICAPVTFTITAIDTEQQVCPTIFPPTRQYDLANPGNAATTISWNHASSVTSVRDNGTLVNPTHYTVVASTLTILDDPYLAGKLTTVGDHVVLTITFDICAPVTFTITAIDTEQVFPVGLTGYPVNKLAVMAPWIVLGASIIVGASLLALKRRRRA